MAVVPVRFESGGKVKHRKLLKQTVFVIATHAVCVSTEHEAVF